MSVISRYYNRPLGIYKMSAARRDKVMLLCKRAQAKRVLDIGCGVGDFGALLKKAGIYVVGADISEIAIKKASEVLDEAVILDFEEEEWPWQPGSFDTVVISEVIEHLFYPESMLKNISAVLGSGGSIIVTTPNFLMFSNRIRMLLGQFEYADSGFLDRGHIHFFTRLSLLSLLKSSGYRVIDEENVFHPKVPKWLARRFPNLFTYQMVIRAVKNENEH